MDPIKNIDLLAAAIKQTNQFFLNKVQKQINTSLTLRNWVIGCYIVEYEQNGEDRAEYGEQLYVKLAQHLKKTGIKGLSFTTLHLCKQLYGAYPQILQAVIEEFKLPDFQINRILPSVTEESDQGKNSPANTLLKCRCRTNERLPELL